MENRSVAGARLRPGQRRWRQIVQHRAYYLLLLPAVAYVALFCYVPMYGLQIAFKNYKGYLGIAGSPWVGLAHFRTFFSGVYFWQLFRNTLTLSLYSLIAGFPLPILIALLLNEVNLRFSKITRTILYAPPFYFHGGAGGNHQHHVFPLHRRGEQGD